MHLLPTIIVGAVMLLATGPHTGFLEGKQSGSERATLYPNYGPPPASFDELWEGATLVVRGVVENSHVRRATPSGPPSVVTDHRVRVLEVLKGNAGEAPKSLHVLQTAGSLTVDGKQITVDPGAMPVLTPGQEALLFLQEWRKGSGFVLVAGPAGLHVLDEDTIRVPSFMRSMFAEKAQVSKTEFLSGVRQHKRKE